MSARRKIRICCVSEWATALHDCQDFLRLVPTLDVSKSVTDPSDADLVRRGRLDCDWYAENARCFAEMVHPLLEFLPACVTAPRTILEFAQLPREPGEERWLVMIAQQPQFLGKAAGPALALLARHGVRTLFYAFDEASRFMPCFRDIAPYLSVLIHDEAPLESAGERLLPPKCLRIHRSWVANLTPFAAPFNEAAEPRILFLGSQLGLTEHRKRQIVFLERRFRDRFVASHDHSVSVADRLSLNRFKVSVCPEGRKFSTPAMARTHTDRPFWSGCLGMVPVSEDSRQGGRLEELFQAGLLLRYPRGDLDALASCCEQALEMPHSQRRMIYEHFNRVETVGTVVANAIAAVI